MQTKAQVATTRRDADEYVLDTLMRLEMELDRSLTQARNGIRTLQAELDKTGAPLSEPQEVEN